MLLRGGSGCRLNCVACRAVLAMWQCVVDGVEVGVSGRLSTQLQSADHRDERAECEKL